MNDCCADGCGLSEYELPTITFVGGSTQDLVFHTYWFKRKEPYDLTFCKGQFSLIDYLNKSSTPDLTKEMTVELSTKVNEQGIKNLLRVILKPNDTKELRGKYIYQITVTDKNNGDVDIPHHGLIYIIDNIDYANK